MHFNAFLTVAAVMGLAVAKDVIVTVGGNSTGSSPFKPQSVQAKEGDRVIFKFVGGNHSVIESVFPAPCIPAHDHDVTLNGFHSGFRDTVNGTAKTELVVPIDAPRVNTTIWFFDASSCAQGGVGGININQDGNETLAGFTRNAARLNGSESETSLTQTSTSGSGSPTDASNAPGPSGTPGNDAQRIIGLGAKALFPLIVLSAFCL